ncbi:non-ribosomal peptide synthetase, partial [Streptomyces sp. V2]
ATHPVAPHHFNMSLAFETAPDTDADALRTAVAALLNHHDALRTVFTRHGSHWTSEVRAAADAQDVLEIHDLPNSPDAEARWCELAIAAQSGLNLDRGPLLRVLLGRRGPAHPAWLFVTAHHLVMDGVSLRILLEDLQRAYEQAVSGAAVDLGPKTTSIRQWADRLGRHDFNGQAEYWRSVTEAAHVELPVDHPGGDNTVAAQRFVTVALSAEQTEALLSRVPSVYRTQVNDVLLTALARTLRTWTGRDRIVVNLEGHGREELFDGIDLSRTVGWFTAIHPVALELPGDDWGTQVRSIKEQLRAVPDRGVGYGALRYLNGRPLADDPHPQLSFNYHGQFSAGADTTGLLRAPLDVEGQDHAPTETRTHLIDVIGIVQDGRLAFSWAYSAALHDEATVRGVAEDFAAELVSFVEHCAQDGVGGCSPSDFPLVSLSQEQVDLLVGDGRGVDDVYPLTPLQAGMVFHALAEPESAVYVEQLAFSLEGVRDIRRLGRAWQRVAARSDALRVSVVWQGVAEPVQVVHREVPVPVEELDWSDLTPQEQEERLRAYLREDRDKGFDLGVPPLMRVALVRLSDTSVRVVWTFHHVLLDGWSSAAFLSDVLAEYGGSAEVVSRRDFRGYVEWLGRQDREAGREFWRGVLAGFTEPVELPYDRSPEGPSHQSSECVVVSVVGGVGEFARGCRVTSSVVVQGAWALVLAQVGGVRDVVFGGTVSGRPGDLAGVEGMVGLFINTLPVRVGVVPGLGVGEWLRGLQGEQVEARRYEYVALSEMETELPAGVGLFDSLVVFENYPVDADAAEQQGVVVGEFEAAEATNYPLTVVAGEGADSLDLSLAYDPALFDRATVEGLAGRLVRAIAGLADADVLGAVELVDREERALVVDEWSGGRGVAAGRSVVEVFGERVAEAPDAVAVVCGEESLTYA